MGKRAADNPIPAADKLYDREYFDRWYRRQGIGGASRLAGKVALAVATAEYHLERPIRNVLDIGAGEAAWRAPLLRLRPKLHYLGFTAATTPSHATVGPGTCITPASATSPSCAPARRSTCWFAATCCTTCPAANWTAACPAWWTCAVASPSWRHSPARMAPKATSMPSSRDPAFLLSPRWVLGLCGARLALLAGAQPAASRGGAGTAWLSRREGQFATPGPGRVGGIGYAAAQHRAFAGPAIDVALSDA